MIDKLKLWLQAEISSKLLSTPPFESYAEIAEQFTKELHSTQLPHGLREEVKRQAVLTLLAIMEVRTRKILWELGQGRTLENVTAEEERLVRPLVKILQAQPQGRKAEDYVVVQFLMSHPAVLTEDFVQIGPFNRGDLAKLPSRDAKDLERQGVVRRFMQ
ncbi:MAG: DNA replication initiation complex subunit [Pyrobaculum sp.]